MPSFEDRSHPASPGRPAFASWLGRGNSITQQFLAFGKRPDLIALSGGLPAPELYPVEAIGEAASRGLARQGAAALGYGAVEGLDALRAFIARRLSTERLSLGPDNVLVTAGSLQALELLGTALLDPGDTIVAEYPTYLGALDAWLPRQPAYRALEAGVTWEGAKFAYVVPNFSNPTGAVMDEPARRALLEEARRSGIWLVEDDPYGELRYGGTPLPSLLEMSAEPGALAYAGPVVHLGTLSKTIAPGLRVGWAVAAPEMIQALARAKQGTDLSTSPFCQAVALELVEAGVDRQHAPRLVEAYRSRRDALCEALREHLASSFHWEVPQGGMFVWLTAREPGFDTDAFLAFALEAGVAFVPGSVFDPSSRPGPSLRLNFTANPPERIREGVARLARALDAFSARRAAAE